MAFRRKARATRSRSRSGRTGRRYATTRVRRSRRSAPRRSGGHTTVRLVIEQPAQSAVSRPAELIGMTAAAPAKKARF